MLKRLLFCLTLITLTAAGLNAQLPEPCPPGSANPTGECETSCIHCNFINGYQGTTDGQAPSSVPNYCGSIENDQWFGFIASCNAATFTASPIAGTCDNGDGIQIALYQQCGGAFLQCNVGQSGGGMTPVSISVSGMIPGQNYFLVIDGYAGDQCDFAISVIPPSCVQGPPVGPAQPITGPSKVCPGSVVTYCTPALPNAGAYVWTCNNPAVLINGESSMVEVVGQAGNCVTVEFPANMPNTNVQICVKAKNSCSEGAPICRTITVAKIPPSTAPLQVICFEDCPGITLPDGSSINCNPGVTTYPVTYVTPALCDSVVNYPVRVKPPIITSQNKTICSGSCVDVGGQTFCDPGFYNMTVDSYQGCDSVINLSLTVIQVNAIINGMGPLTCTNNPIPLGSVSSTGTKTWTLNGQPAGSGNTINATTAGQYILTVQQTIAPGVVCIAKDTVDVVANNTPPTATATNGILGCGTPTAPISVTTNATSAVYAWPSGVTPQNSANPSVTTPGNYVVTVTNTANGCTNTATSAVTGNTTPPSVTTTGATLNCTNTLVAISASASGTVTYAWPAGATPNNVAMPTVTSQGNYIVTVTNTSNNCTSTATAAVVLDNAQPNAGASVSGNIGCTTPTVNLVGSSTTAGVTYAWPSGPGQTVPTMATGNYIVTVTGPNGCTNTAQATVQGSTTAPGAAATGGTLTCAATQIQLGGTSSTAGVTFAWTGPGGTSPQPNPFVSAPGPWNLVVTNPQNGCTSAATANVGQDIAAPSVSATGGIIDCVAGQVALGQSFSPSNSTILWTNAASGFSSTTPSPTVTATGTYTIVVTGPNGCTSSTTAQVAADANVPVLDVAVSNPLDCNNTTATITGSTPTSGATISVQPPTGGPTSTTTFSATAPGNYVYTVTATNGCKSTVTATVQQNITPPGASATGATVTCTSPSVPIAGSSPTAGVTYAWSSPAGFTSALQNPSITDPGTYTVTVTNPNTGCTSTATATVAADQNTPVAAATGGTITCAAAAVGLQGSVNLAGSTFAWSGPGFSSVAQNPTVDVPGNYVLTTTSPNGCTDQATAIVALNQTAPNATAAGETLTCAKTQVTLDGGSTTTGVSFSWSGPNGFGATQSDPTNAGAAGNYLLTVTDPVNGCTSTATAVVDADVALPNVSGTGGTLTCANDTIPVAAASTTPGATFSWAGPGAFSSTVQNPDVWAGGMYALTAKGPNGCENTVQVNVAVDKNPPANFAASGGTVTCTITSVQGSANTTTVGSTFEWFLNNALVGTGQAIDLVSAGTYSVVATGPNGCQATTSAAVVQNGAFPTAVPAVTNILNCNTPSATLSATTSAATAGYEWFLVQNNVPTSVAGTATFDVTTAGTYQVAITDVNNGCKTTVPIDVVEDFSLPTNVVAVGGTIDCISGQIQIEVGTPPQGVTYAWSGPGFFVSTDQNPTVTNEGDYTCIVTKTSNGCTDSAVATVVKDANAPTANIAGTGTITCTNPTVALTGSTTTPSSTGAWAGPGGFSSINAAIVAQDSGTYVWTVINTTNQCKTSASIKINEDTDAPKGVTTNGTVLTCKPGPYTIVGNSTTFGATYAWTGPGTFTSNVKSPAVTVIGSYTLTVTGPNGCTTTATTNVTEDKEVPQNLEITPFTIDCINFEGEIEVSTTSTGAFTYRWGNPTFITGATTKILLVDAADDYTVTVTNTGNGCTSTATITVDEDTDPPVVATSVSGLITCQQTTVQVTATTVTPGATYKWSGPGIVGANNVATITVNAVGGYKVTVTNPANGCIDIRTQQVMDDGSIPSVSVNTGTITCAVTSLVLNAESNQTVNYSWSTGATTQQVTVTAGGAYSITVTNPVTGCKASFTSTVASDLAAPSVNLTVDGQFTCSDTIVGISSAVLPAGGQYSYEWSGPSIVGSTTSAAINTAAIGDYELIVTNTVNGCSTTETDNVTANDDVPSGLALNTKNIRCFGETNGFAAITGITGGTPPYLYSLNGAPYSAAVAFQNLAAGTYSLGLEDVLGCKYVTTFDITEPEKIVVNLGNDTTVALGNSVTMDLTNIISPPSPDYTLNWAGSFLGCDTCESFLLTPLSSQALGLTVIDSNGCRAQDVVFIEVDKPRNIYIPSIFAPESDDNNKFYIFAGIDCEEIENFLVYDRWGEVVSDHSNFQPNDPFYSWDGTYRGKNVNPGVYVYWARIRFIDGIVKIYKGSVTVDR